MPRSSLRWCLLIFWGGDWSASVPLAKPWLFSTMHILGLLIILSCLPSALLDFAVPKWKADKAVRAEDAYKWLYQATRGGEHAVPDEDSARKWLDVEWLTLGQPAKDELGWEPLCPGGDVGRLNLRPFKQASGKEDDLLSAFLASSREYRPNPADFVEVWQELGVRLQKHPFGKLNHRTWQKVDSEMKPQNYPAIHHSKPYEEARHPAYRVLIKAQAQKLLPID